MPTLETHAISAEPNVVPLIDVLLVLLIIFMLLAMRQQRSLISAQLPPERPSAISDAPTIVLEVGPGPVYAINRQPISTDELSTELRRLYAGQPDKTILIEGDPNATYQEVFTGMDVARGSGVRVLGLWTQK